MADSGMKPLTGEAENVYRLLTKDEVSSGERTRVTRRLERAGIDINQLDRDLVTYQAVRSYLKRDRGAEYASDDRDRTVVETENVQRLRGRMTTVIGGKLEQLQRADNLVLGEGRVIVEFNVLCETCGTRYDIEELLDRGGCDCAGRE
jgi:DNA-binding transcriptional ArsR family regulator